MSISTAVDQNAVARVLGIKTAYKNLRSGSTLTLPQRVAVFAQGASASVFSSTKRQISSALEAGQVYGFGSPIHLAALQLLPVNGDGVGTIPVTVYPLEDGAVAAAGEITPAGPQVTSASYRVVFSGIRSPSFTILAGADVTAMCRAIHDAVLANLNIPMIPTYTYGTVTALADPGNAGNGTVTVLSVTGSPKPGLYDLRCNTEVANGGVFTLTDPDGTVLATNITMTPGAGGATVINNSGLQFTITDGANDFDADDFFTLTVPATDVQLEAKWAGITGNDIAISVEGSTTAGVTFAITQPTGGLTDPSVADALAQVGDVWETIIVNGLASTDEDILDEYHTFGESRWGALTRKPLVVFSGTVGSDLNTVTALTDSRTGDFTNVLIPAPGAKVLPFVLAARAVARVALQGTNNPARDYSNQYLTGIEAGTDGEQWNYTQRNIAVTRGCSTTEVVDGVIRLSDVVTFYHPTGDATPAYRYVVDIVKLQNILFNLNLIFASDDWAGAPLIPDDQPTTNREAKKPKTAVAAVSSMIDALALDAIISNPAGAKASVQAEIDEENPKRLNLVFTVALSGNTTIISIDFNFGFLFGTSAIVS